MALIHPLSSDCVKNELDLFSVPSTQTSIEEGRWLEMGPITPVGNDSDTIEFNIPASVCEYIDLSSCYIRVKAKVVKTSGDTLTGPPTVNDDPPADNVAPHKPFSACSIQSSRFFHEKHSGNDLKQHLPLQSLHRNSAEFWRRCQRQSTHSRFVV